MFGGCQSLRSETETTTKPRKVACPHVVSRRHVVSCRAPDGRTRERDKR